MFKYGAFSVRDEFCVTLNKLQLTCKFLKLFSVVLNSPVFIGKCLNLCIAFVLYTLMYVVSQFSGQHKWIVSIVPPNIENKYS